MVDADVVIPGVIDKGKLLTLTTTEALKLAVADVRADNLEVVLEYLKLQGAEVRRPTVNWAEQLVRFFTHPVLSSILMTIGLLGIIVELRTPGFGVPGAIGIVSLGLFFWGHWLVRLAGWEEILLVALGLVLLALEIFVIPGFGITGVLGILSLLAGLALSLIGAGATGSLVLYAVGRVSLSILIAIGVSLALMRFLPRLPFGRRLVLDTGMDTRAGYASAPETDLKWVGKRGMAATPLRPAGIADLEGERVDVVSQGEYIETDAPIEVVRVDGNRIVVRRAIGGRDKA
jgi:membrane-bound serine protease (ClpP class)